MCVFFWGCRWEKTVRGTLYRTKWTRDRGMLHILLFFWVKYNLIQMSV